MLEVMPSSPNLARNPVFLKLVVNNAAEPAAVDATSPTLKPAPSPAFSPQPTPGQPNEAHELILNACLEPGGPNIRQIVALANENLATDMKNPDTKAAVSRYFNQLLRVGLLLAVDLYPEFPAHLMVYDLELLLEWQPALKKHKALLDNQYTFSD